MRWGLIPPWYRTAERRAAPDQRPRRGDRDEARLPRGGARRGAAWSRPTASTSGRARRGRGCPSRSARPPAASSPSPASGRTGAGPTAGSRPAPSSPATPNAMLAPIHDRMPVVHRARGLRALARRSRARGGAADAAGAGRGAGGRAGGCGDAGDPGAAELRPDGGPPGGFRVRLDWLLPAVEAEQLLAERRQRRRSWHCSSPIRADRRGRLALRMVELAPQADALLPLCLIVLIRPAAWRYIAPCARGRPEWLGRTPCASSVLKISRSPGLHLDIDDREAGHVGMHRVAVGRLRLHPFVEMLEELGHALEAADIAVLLLQAEHALHADRQRPDARYRHPSG